MDDTCGSSYRNGIMSIRYPCIILALKLLRYLQEILHELFTYAALKNSLAMLNSGDPWVQVVRYQGCHEKPFYPGEADWRQYSSIQDVKLVRPVKMSVFPCCRPHSKDVK